MSANSTHTQPRQVTRFRKLPRHSAASGRGGNIAAAVQTKRLKASAVRGTAATLVTSLLILVTVTAQTPPPAAVRTQRTDHSSVRAVPEAPPRHAANSARRHGAARAGASEEFARLRERITERLLGYEPEEYRMLGKKDVGGHLKDWSPAAIAEQVKFCREAIRELGAAVVEHPDDILDRDVLLSNLTYLEHYYGRYHGELGNLQISVYPYELIQYELLRFATGDRKPDSARAHFSAIEGVLRGLPGYLEQQQSNLLAGLKLRAPDKAILERLMERIGWPGDERSIRAGLRDLEQRLKSDDLKASLSAAQVEELGRLLRAADVAYKRHLDFLQTSIVPRAGLSWPLGRDEYVLRLRLLYGYRGTLEDLVRPAEEALRKIKEEMKSLARELRPDAPRTDALHLKVLQDLRQKQFDNEQELLDAYRQVQQKIDAALTTGLGLPAGTANYQPAPPGVPVGSATNWPAPLLSPGDALVLVDTSEGGLRANFKANIAWIADHEGNPGHAAQSRFFQSAYNNGSAPLCRFLNVPDEVGYVRGNWYAMANIEGWAFYTERLLLDKNLLSPEERLAALTGQALRAARVVVDVRMHTAGWSRERAADYLVNEAGLSCEDAHDQAHRYSKIPLQALSYFMGASEFEKLHRNYGKRYGDRFYSRVLSLGPVPPVLIDKYLAASTLQSE
ncbi:MAG TPA: DUF885 domain-containing protein [Pyrinomonadaceae bacterium]